MIKYFTVENYYSIKNESILVFDEGLSQDVGYSAQPVIGFAGANASGKTNILKALSFVMWFMRDSFLEIKINEKMPFEPFYSTKHLPTRFQLIFSITNGENKRIDYEYKLTLTTEQVLSEELYYYPDGIETLVYARQAQTVEFGPQVNPIPTQDLRQNCALVSFATQFASQEMAITCKNYEFYSNLTFKGILGSEFQPEILSSFLKDEKTYQEVRELLKIADMGIEGFYLKKQTKESVKKGVKENLQATLEKFEPFETNNTKGLFSQLFGVFDGFLDQVDIESQLAFFKHKIDGELVDFKPDAESDGTRKFLAILYHILNALPKGGLFIIDEIESELHQNLVAYLIGWFQNEARNPKGAQLIFSFHNSYLMKFLTPEQLYFAEKNDDGQTALFAAADFEDIQDLHAKNLEKLYRIGRFGATPRGL